MKAIIEIEIGIIGDYIPGADDEKITCKITESIDSLWILDEEKFDVFAKSASCRIEGEP